MIPLRAPVVVFLVLLVGAANAGAVGLHLGCEIVSLDVTGTFLKVPVALDGASGALLDMLADQGLPPAELAEIEADFDAAAADLVAGLEEIPGLLPFPLLGAAIEIPVSLVVVDSVRFGGAILDTELVRGVAAAAGVEIPDPLFDQEVDLGGETGRVTADAAVSAWTVTADVTKRLDLWIAAFSLSAGVGYSTGTLAVEIEHELPAPWTSGVEAALAALHLDDVRWSSFTVQFGGRLEIGLPFLRLFIEARLVQPIVEWVGWWDLRVGGWSGSVGVVIRF